MNGDTKDTHTSSLIGLMVQESHTQDTVNVTNIELTKEQEDILWWEHYEQKIYSEEQDNGSLPI